MIVPSQGLRLRAGYGLFAARPFKNGDRIGLYIGQTFDLNTFPERKWTCCAASFDVKKTVKQTSLLLCTLGSTMPMIPIGTD